MLSGVVPTREIRELNFDSLTQMQTLDLLVGVNLKCDSMCLIGLPNEERPPHLGLPRKQALVPPKEYSLLYQQRHEKVMHDVLDIAKVPVIFSHSSARGINGHPRNVPDSVLARLPENGGVVMVTFVPSYLNEALRVWNAERAAASAKLESLWQGQPERFELGMIDWINNNPQPQSSVQDVADHIDHIRLIAGIDHIGIGGDYDGIPYAPPGLEDVSRYPTLFVELAKRGYTQADLEKISMRNALRALREAELYSEAQGSKVPLETLID